MSGGDDDFSKSGLSDPSPKHGSGDELDLPILKNGRTGRLDIIPKA